MIMCYGVVLAAVAGLITLIGVTGDSVCQGNITGTTCLEFQGPFRTRSWSAAVSECGGLGGHLVSVPNEERQLLLQELMDEVGVTAMWLGLQDILADEWGFGGADGGVIQEQGCYTDRNTSPDLPITADLLPNEVTPDLCIDWCAANGYIYAGTQNGEECWCGNSFGNNNVLTTGCTIRCRANNFMACGGFNMNFIYRVDGVYGEWKENQPNNFDNYQFCGGLDSSAQYKYGDESCDGTNRFVCDLPGIELMNCTQADQDGGMIPDNTTCYYVSNKSVTWFEAQQECWDRFGTLLRVASSAQRVAVGHILDSYSTNSDPFFWTGLTRRDLTWDNGDMLTYVNWSPGSPTRFTDECFMMAAASAYTWQDVSCGRRLPFFCEFDIRPTTILPETTTALATTISLTTVVLETTNPPTTEGPSTTLVRSTSDTPTTDVPSTLVPSTTVAMGFTSPPAAITSDGDISSTQAADLPTTTVATTEVTTVITTDATSTASVITSTSSLSQPTSALSQSTSQSEISTSSTRKPPVTGPTSPVTGPTSPVTGPTSPVIGPTSAENQPNTTVAAPPTGQASTDDANSNRNLLIGLIVAVCILIVAIVGALGVFIFFRKKNKSPVHPEAHYDREPESSINHYARQDSEVSYATWVNTNVPMKTSRAKQYENGSVSKIVITD